MKSTKHNLEQEHATPEERYARIVGELLNNPGVTPPPDGSQAKKKFGSSGLRIDNKIFAMLVRGKLVLKLPKTRVDSLIASGDGEPFESGQGRVMKEWVTMEPESTLEWLDLAQEALKFVGAKS
jgi:hypothetical protein